MLRVCIILLTIIVTLDEWVKKRERGGERGRGEGRRERERLINWSLLVDRVSMLRQLVSTSPLSTSSQSSSRLPID